MDAGGSTVVEVVMEPFSHAFVPRHGCACLRSLMGDGFMIAAVPVNSQDVVPTTVVLVQCAVLLMQF